MYNLLFHDTSINSGFLGSQAEKYKISKLIFFRIINILKGEKQSKEITLTFDDGGESINSKLIKQIIPYFKVKIFISTKYINSKGFLSSLEIKKLHNLGVIIGSHSHSHKKFKFNQYKSFINDWTKSKIILENIIGDKVENCSIPYGLYAEWQLKKLYEMGFKKIYTSDPKPINFFDDTFTKPRIPVDSRLFKFELYIIKIFRIKYLYTKHLIYFNLKKFIYG